MAHYERKMNKRNTLLVFVVLFSLLSTACTLFLLYTVFSSYKQGLLIRLDPGQTSFAPDSFLQASGTECCIVLLGDSRIASWDPLPQADGQSYLNRGISGQTTAQILLRIEEDCLNHDPEIVVIEAGINDCKAIAFFPEQKEKIIRNCISNLSQIVHRLQAKDIHVILLTVWPPGDLGIRRRIFWSEQIDSAIREINTAIRQFADEYVQVLDCDVVLADNGRVRAEYRIDDFHINDQGYQQLNKVLIEDIFTLLRKKSTRAVQ